MQSSGENPAFKILSTSRRQFLKLGTMTAVVGLFPIHLFAAVNRDLTTEKNLAFYNTHTNESLNACYYRQGNYCVNALKKINYILRDHRNNEIKPIDKQLLEFLHAISLTLGTRSPFHVISGYRSPNTNSMLRKKSKKVAAKSLHMWGRAIDIRHPEYSTSALRKVAIDLQLGGVGYYPHSDFVHVDTGQVRHWQ